MRALARRRVGESAPATAAPSRETRPAGRFGGIYAAAGRPLPPSLRTEMQGRFGADFSSVRLHTDDRAAASAAAFGARAYTIGRDVYFGAGQFQPSSTAGRRLIAHELAHVVQQGGRDIEPQAKRGVSRPGDPAEVAADDAARGAVAGQAVRLAPLPAAGPAILRDTSTGLSQAAIDERCHPTQRLPGGIGWLGSIAHLAIAAHFEQQFPGAEFEYHIPRSSPRNRSGYVDIAYLPDRALYEIKPLHRLDEADVEVQRYVDRANQYCGGGREWIRGLGYVGGGPIMELMGLELYSDLTLSGCITYEWVPGAIIEGPLAMSVRSGLALARLLDWTRRRFGAGTAAEEAVRQARFDDPRLGRLPEVHGTIQSASPGRAETEAESVTYDPRTGTVLGRRMK